MGNKQSANSTSNVGEKKTQNNEFFTFSSNYPNTSQVLQAAYMKNPAVIIDLYHEGLDLNMNLNSEGWRIIHVASQTGNKELAKFLISKKADINAAELTQNWTPLMVAVFNNNYDIVELLIKHKADKKKLDKEGKTALAYALQYNYTKIFNRLSCK